jgi:hypothetical protein
MNIEVALKIITALSEGVNPDTGEVLSDQSSFNNPQTIRALFLAKESLEKSLKSEKRKGDLPINAGKPWGPEEDAELASRFESGIDINQLPELHGRTKGSINARLVRLGKINE